MSLSAWRLTQYEYPIIQEKGVTVNSDSFTEFNNEFYTRFDDLELFNCREDLNLLKTVLGALKVNYAAKGEKVGLSLFRHDFIFFPIELLRRLKAQPRVVPHRVVDFLICTYNRRTVVRDGRLHSLYFDRIVDSISPLRRFIVSDASAQNDVSSDFEIDLHNTPILDKELVLLRKDLLKIYRKFVSSGKFSVNELYSIRMEFQIFFMQYAAWSNILKKISAKSALLVCHYHKEGQIYALKRHGLKVVELQHGLIDKSDIFYCFPSNIAGIRSKCLFSDFMLTFGTHWSDILRKGHEFRSDDIYEIGYYLQSDSDVSPFIEVFCRSKSTLMVATQFNLTEVYIKYIWVLVESYPEVQIIIRPHPSEKKDAYDCFKNINQVMIANTGGVDVLLPLVSCVVSIYSTVLLDAVRFRLPSFAISISECKDYVESITSCGYVIEIPMDSNPLSHIAEYKKCHVDSSKLYSEFSSVKLLEILESKANPSVYS